MAEPKVSSGERRAIAALADGGAFALPTFVSRCVRTGEPPYVMWRAVEAFAYESGNGCIAELAIGAIEAQGYDEASPPPDIGDLQVVLDLDEPKGWVVARWRDAYADADDGHAVDMAVEFLSARRLCWNCGDDGVMKREHLPWCVACDSNYNKE